MFQFLDVRTSSFLHYRKIRRFPVYKKLILIQIVFNLVKKNCRVKDIILRLKFLVLFLNQMERVFRGKIKITDSGTQRIEFFPVHFLGRRQQNHFSF